MAVSGSLTITIMSRDYPYNAGTDSPKGRIVHKHRINYHVDDNWVATFSHGGIISGDNSWYIDNSGTSCRVHFNGQVLRHTNKSPVRLQNTTSVLVELINQIGAVQLPGNGELKISFGSDRAPAPTFDRPNAFPSSAVSEGDQVTVQIIVPPKDYRPGQRKISGQWWSLNRNGGGAVRRAGGFHELRTKEGQGDPPLRKANGNWYNQRKIGKES